MLKEKLSGIYCIVNKVNFKVYVGSAVDLERRKYDHVKDLRKNRHYNSKLQNAWNKYGEDNFVFDVLEFVEDKTKLLDTEQFWIDFSSCVSIGYNINPTAYSRLGAVLSTETKKKIGDSSRGRFVSEDTRKKISNRHKGREDSEETRKKKSISSKNSEKAIAHRERVAESRKGTKVSDETKKKISDSLKGTKLSDETKRKISEAGLNRIVSEDTRRKISTANKGRKCSEETKKKISETKKRKALEKSSENTEIVNN